MLYQVLRTAAALALVLCPPYYCYEDLGQTCHRPTGVWAYHRIHMHVQAWVIGYRGC